MRRSEEKLISQNRLIKRMCEDQKEKRTEKKRKEKKIEEKIYNSS